MHPVLLDELVMIFTCWHRVGGVKRVEKKSPLPFPTFWHVASVNNTFKGPKRLVFLFPAVNQSLVEVFTSMLYA